MAKKSDSDFSKPRRFRELDEALQRSFVNIKNDMTALKESLHQQGVKLAEAKQGIKDNRADFVTIDKFNILKIKIGELNENMKKVWDIEKKLEDVDRKTVSAAEFDKHSVGVDNEFTKVKEDLKELSDTVATEEQTKQLAEDINSEFDNIKQAMEELRSIKDTITRAELEKRTAALNKRADDVRDDFDKLKAGVKAKVNASQVESLIGDINSEFDRLKDTITDIKEGEKRFALGADVEKQIKKLDKKQKDLSQGMTSAIDEFSKGIELTFKDFAKNNEKKHAALLKDMEKADRKLSGRISEVKDDLKSFITKKQAENLVNDLNKEFDAVKSDIDGNSKDISLLGKGSATKKELTSEISGLKKDLDRLSKDISRLKKESATKDETHGLFDDLKQRIADTNNALKDRFNDMIKRIKKESDSAREGIKENSQDIDEMERSMKKELKPMITDDELHDELDVVKDEFEKLHKELKSIQNRMLEESDLNDVNKRLKQHITATKKEFINKRHFNRLFDAVARLNDQVDIQSLLIKEKNKELKAYARELRAARKAERKLARYESVVVKSDRKAKKKSKKKKDAVPYSRSSFLANFLIGAAFVVLIAAICFFLGGMTSITDIFAIAAVICFVIGIIIRIAIAFKRNGN